MKSIIIVEDHSIVSFGIETLLKRKSQYSIIGSYKSGVEGLKEIKSKVPDIAIIDLNLIELNGEAIVLNLFKSKIKTKIIILSRKKYLPQVSHLLKLGISAYIIKDDAAEELLSALDYIKEDKVYISSSIKDLMKITGYLGKDIDLSISSNQLTDREKEITRMLSNGKSNDEIAKSLTISPATIRVHVSNILRKLALGNTRELVKAGSNIF